MPATRSKAKTSSGDGPMVTLALLGGASALWALFLWRELLRARAGATPFCGFGESADCGDLWNAAFASTIHDASGLPVAAWGLVWSTVACLLPLAAALSEKRAELLRSAVRVTALAGVAGVVVLLGASAAEGKFCTSCALTYVLTFAYAATAALGLRGVATAPWLDGTLAAAGTTLGVYLLLLYPGLQTPKNVAAQGERALAAAARSAAEDDSGFAPIGSRDSTSASESAAPPGGPRDRQLTELLASLPPQALQHFSSLLHLHRAAPTLREDAPRTLVLGEMGASVRVTEFTDVLCGHCADLHRTMAALASMLPPSAFRLDARHFPLDGRCNPHMSPREGEDTRCLGAKAQICMEGTGQSFHYAAALFERQEGLTPEMVLDLGAAFLDRDTLVACIESPETAAKLAQDVEYAWRHRPHGTPVVLINGRQGYAFGPFLYAMILTGGATEHPAFASLPEPQADVHAH